MLQLGPAGYLEGRGQHAVFVHGVPGAVAAGSRRPAPDVVLGASFGLGVGAGSGAADVAFREFLLPHF